MEGREIMTPDEFVRAKRPAVMAIPLDDLEAAVEHLLQALGRAVHPVTRSRVTPINLGPIKDPNSQLEETARRLRRFSVEVLEEISGCKIILIQ